MNAQHILLVEDDIYAVNDMKTHLEKKGFRVTPAFGCKQALAALQGKDKFDLMILDYFMPDGSGTDILRSMEAIKEMQRPPVIVSSAIVDPANPLWQKLQSRLPEEIQALIKAYVSCSTAVEAVDIALNVVLGGDYIP